MKHNVYTQTEKNNKEVAIPSFSNSGYDNILYNTLSPIYTDIKDIQAILDANKLYTDKIDLLKQTTLYNYFIKTCSLDRLREYEQICGIISNERLDENIRREQVILKFNFVLPYTIVKLKEILNSTCGIGNWELTQDLNKYELQIQVKESYTDMIEILQQTLYYIIPCHIRWIITKEINKEVIVNQYIGGASYIVIDYRIECDMNYIPPENINIEGDIING